MSASSSKGEGSYGEFIEADLDSYEKLFRAFMKRDSSVIDFFTTGEGSDDNAMAYPGRYSQIFREYMRWSYGGVSLENFTFVKLTHTHSTLSKHF